MQLKQDLKFRLIVKLLIKVFLIFAVLFVGVILLDRIDFPTPIKKIEKIIPNENFRLVSRYFLSILIYFLYFRYGRRRASRYLENRKNRKYC